MTFSQDPSPQPDERADKLDKAEKGAIQLVETREDATKVLELVETALDQMPLAVEPGIVHPLDLGRLMRRDDRFTALGFDVGDEGRAGIAAIRQDFREGQPIE